MSFKSAALQAPASHSAASSTSTQLWPCTRGTRLFLNLCY